MISPSDPRIVFATDAIGRGLITYKCPSCRRLLKAPLGQDGDRCPSCESGYLQTVSRVSTRMLAEHERAVSS